MSTMIFFSLCCEEVAFEKMLKQASVYGLGQEIQTIHCQVVHIEYELIERSALVKV